jgi:hypothetical protein
MEILNLNLQKEGAPTMETAEAVPTIKPISSERLLELTRILQRYKSDKTHLDQRVIASENWWKLRNTSEEQNDSTVFAGAFSSRSAWLHNVITQKHADAVEAYPEPNILGREASDKEEANMLSDIVPCILEQNHFEATYSEAMWRKMKTGTAVYKIVWDKNKLGGLGDIGVECVNVLNLFWESGITDIQKSRYVFHTELWDKDLLLERYPEELKGGLKGDDFIASKFLYDDKVDTENKATVIEVYYHKYVGGKKTLQYIKYVGDKVLYATENETEPMGVDPMSGVSLPSMAERGLYDHGLYPYVFDALYPVEGSPCGYGYVDICRNPQTEIDLLKTCFVKNARAGALPRYFSRVDGNVNEEIFCDLTKSLIPVAGNVDEASIRRVDHQSIDGSYMNLLQWDVNELKETSGNTDASTGATPSGVTAASAIAALQEASGKGSRDSTKNSYRAFSKVVEICIELIRQFYDAPRKFRVLGQYGMEKYITYTNQKLKAQQQMGFGEDPGARLPVFDIKVSAQKANVYTKVTQNELALQFFKLGFCNPQMSDQALMCLDMMDFEGKDDIMQKIAQNGTMFQKLVQYMQMALMLAQVAAPQYVNQIAMDMQATTGQAPQMGGGAAPQMTESDNIAGIKPKEHGVVEKARERAGAASQPT